MFTSASPRFAVDLRGALAAVLDGNDVPPRVRDEIGASWQRSVAAGLQPDKVEVPFDPDLGGDGVLVRAARPVLDQLAIDLIGAPVGIVLADERGVVVDRRAADARLSARLESILLAPGFVYAEDMVGTNGIGTALAQRSPAAVEGEEHFADDLITLACAGAPIFDPRDGHLLGAIDLTSLAGDGSALMLPFAARAAREIEQRLIDGTGIAERLMLQRFLQERRRAKGPLVFITQRTMITNAAAGRLIDAADESVLREYMTMNSAQGGASRVVLTGGIAVSIRYEPLLEGGSRVGAILRLTRTADDRPQPRDGHPAFGWEGLTGTERSVIDLVAAGLTNREAAERLFMSHHTVGFHLRSIFSKLGVSSRVELTRLAVEHDAVEDANGADLFAYSAS
jgi:DNA-binding CsgD family transcriptional regulator